MTAPTPISRAAVRNTPGPWRVGMAGPNGCHTIGTYGGLMVAMVAHSVNWPDQRAQAVADAQMLAAAPEMYEALKRAEQFITNGIEFGAIRMPDESTPDPAHKTLPAIRAAIAAAEGRPSCD